MALLLHCFKICLYIFLLSSEQLPSLVSHLFGMTTALPSKIILKCAINTAWEINVARKCFYRPKQRKTMSVSWKFRESLSSNPPPKQQATTTHLRTSKKGIKSYIVFNLTDVLSVFLRSFDFARTEMTRASDTFIFPSKIGSSWNG